MNRETAVAARAATPLQLSAALRAYLDEAGKPGDGAIASVDDAVHIFKQHQQAETASRIMQGWVIANVMAMGNESMREVATRVATPRTGLQQAASYFHLFQAIPDLDSVRRCAHLEFSLAREVAKWSPAEQIAFVAGQEVRGVTFEAASEMPVTKFLQATRPPQATALESEIVRQKARATTAENHLHAAQLALDDRARKSTEPQWYRIARAEAIALTESMAVFVAELRAVIDEHLAGAPRRSSSDKAMLQMAVDSMFHLGAGVVASMQQVQQYLVAEHGATENLDDAQRAVLTLSSRELEMRLRTRDALVSQADADKKVREWRREQERPRGPGQPKKPPPGAIKKQKR